MMSGARIIIQAPCDIELLDSNSVRLAKGKLVARVPDRAKGFAVETPTVRLTGLGREFGVKVNGSTDVAVLESEPTLASTGQRLKTGHVFRVDQHNRLVQFSTNAGDMELLRPEGMDKQLAGKNLAAFKRWQAYSAELSRAPNLLACYTFKRADENSVTLAEARGRTKFDGRIKGAIWTRGRFPGKEALQFDGVDDCVRLEGGAVRGSTAALALSNWTLAVWFQKTGYGSRNQESGAGGLQGMVLIGKGTGESDNKGKDMNYTLGLHKLDKDNPSTTDWVIAGDFENASDGGNNLVTGTTRIKDNIWYHAAVTYDGTDMKVYLDGSLEGKISPGVAAQTVTRQIAALGAGLLSSGDGRGYFRGVLDEAVIFNVALDAAGIRSLYATSKLGDADIEE
ncbi:MAG: hypothetical protein GY803_02455, partial [Chloroflexi bacterium]|nr:hypothetical protein [Chloroflexota bacterium]